MSSAEKTLPGVNYGLIVGGIANARSLARHYAALTQGGTLDGVTLLSRARKRIAAALQTDQVHELYKVTIKQSLGYRCLGRWVVREEPVLGPANPLVAWTGMQSRSHPVRVGELVK